MRRSVYHGALAALVLAVWAPGLVAQDPSLVLNDGGIRFPDGSVLKTAAAQLIGPAMVPVTGQTTCYDAAGGVIDCGTGIGPGQDGDLTRGIAWLNPRFTRNFDGTVTDNLTGLIWMADASCFLAQTWSEALATASALLDGCSDCGGTNNDCGLTDGSLAGEWRLPNVRELQILAHYGLFNPAVPDTAGTGQWSEGDPFSGVLSVLYWSSTTADTFSNLAWWVDMLNGVVLNQPKTEDKRVWLVRGGQ